jgi:hypothetical protein
MKFVVIESSALRICKIPIYELAGFSDHYYLSENLGIDDSVGWGVNGIEQHTWWKGLSSDVISLLQPAQNISENYNSFMIQQIAEVLNENLRQAKIDKANQDRIEFWENR